MDFKTQQDRFDDIKWYDSILAGCDRCGSYEFCGVCDKAEPNPCARAAYRYQNPQVCVKEAEEEICVADACDEQSALTPIAVIRVKKKRVE